MRDQFRFPGIGVLPGVHVSCSRADSDGRTDVCSSMPRAPGSACALPYTGTGLLTVASPVPSVPSGFFIIHPNLSVFNKYFEIFLLSFGTQSGGPDLQKDLNRKRFPGCLSGTGTFSVPLQRICLNRPPNPGYSPLMDLVKTLLVQGIQGRNRP